ncbi:MAG: DNA mismatch endonuclease Vsr [Erysipelotrichaceae bacterium]
MDKVSVEKRSQNMSRIKSKNTEIEIKVRKYLFMKGYRYRIHSKEIVGKPDVSMKKYKIAIFVNGCFWHGHENCIKATTPKSNTDFWTKKIMTNKERDNKVKEKLILDGWLVEELWECKLDNNFESEMTRLICDIELRKHRNVKIHNKLIRDNIPSIIRKDGKSLDLIVLDQKSFLLELRKKLIEESIELQSAVSKQDIISELADIEEIVETIMKEYEITTEELNLRKIEKRIKNGGFDKKLFLISVTEPGNKDNE